MSEKECEHWWTPVDDFTVVCEFCGESDSLKKRFIKLQIEYVRRTWVAIPRVEMPSEGEE